MRPLRRIVLSSLVWLTAASTLVAGMPVYRCQCPNVAVQPVRFVAPAKKTECCCGGQCCAIRSEAGSNRDSSQNEVAGTCCEPRTDGNRTVQSEGSQVLAHNSSCTQFLFQPEPTSFVQLKTSVAKDLAAAMPLALEKRQSFPPITAGYFHHPDHERPPPTDLLITLQHFLI